LLRIAGPLALAVMAALAGTFLWQTGALTPRATQEKQTLPEIEKPDQTTASKTTYTGVDEQNRPFAINAKAVEQSLNDKNLVIMQSVDGKFERPSGQGLTVTAPAAQYHVNTKALQLEGGVIFAEPGRMTAKMDRAQVDVNSQTLTSNSPVEVDMQGTKISAQSISVTENGTRIYFKGGVRARFMTKP
jgi:LPS export ABC transporter protein LptC